jgi:hypothetical protein
MTFLPIVERELRVASRRWYTFWGRLGAAAFALAIFFGLQLLASVSHGGFKAGQVQFWILKWISFLFACSVGVFLTSDSLSEEKREGTLGLLFLTDLRGHDVVLGKLISHSLQAFYGLMAAVPILGLTMLAGGVAGDEFGHAMLVICNTVFLSVCLGLFVSSISRDVMKAINGALFLSLFILVGLIYADRAITYWWHLWPGPRLSLASPAYLFSAVGPYRFREFWLSLGIQHGLAWMFLILSCICTPRAWQERANVTNATRATFAQRWRFGSKRFRLRLRRRLLARDPILWLGVRDRWLPRFIWCVMGVGIVALAWGLLHFRTWAPLESAAYLQIPFGFGLILWVGTQASRFFVDANRTGALELILVAPVSPAQVVRGQWKALCRICFLPALLLIIVNIAGTEVAIIDFNKKVGNIKGAGGFNFGDFQTAALYVGVVKLAGNLIAVMWVGMWMGMTTRKTSMAVFKTICFVVVVPAIVLSFAQGMMMGMFMFAKFPFWISIAVGGVLNLAKNIFFIVWARYRLFSRFKDAMLRESRIQHFNLPPQIPPLPPLPPMAQPPILPAGVGTA